MPQGEAAAALARIVIENLSPTTPTGEFPAKAVVGEQVTVAADIYADGHDILAARLRWRLEGGRSWRTAPMRQVYEDHWEATIEPELVGAHDLVVEAWRDRFATWRHAVEVKVAVGDDVTVELEEGARLLEARAAQLKGKLQRERVLGAAAGLRRDSCSLHVRLNAGLDDQVAALVGPLPDADLTPATLPLWVDRPRAGFGAWYELFPRSEGGFAGATKRLAAAADMGFDVVYLPPIHPIGVSARKGSDNSLLAGPGDPGSPWAIGSELGGHTAVHPDLGTIEDFRRFCADAADRGLEVALDYALQCSPDHPWVAEHPEWFKQRPDGTIRYAENPPKKYQDIVALDFWPNDEADRVALWEACRDVLRYWISVGVRIFRVDNPHTKPVAFWAWVIDEIRRDHPDVVLLAEAFTKPRVMAKLAEVGFTQSYTYFTWRNTSWELREYVEQLAYGPTASYMRPNFWVNTPDILAGPLRNGPPAAFRMRLVLAATLSPNYGMYSGYELCENEPASPDNEEYLHSEKYEIKDRDWDRADSLVPFITQLNKIRRQHEALQRGLNSGECRLHCGHHSDDDRFLVFSKGRLPGDLVLVVINLDPLDAHGTTLGLDLGAMGLSGNGSYLAHDELSGETYTWEGPRPYVHLDPSIGQVAHILRFHDA